MKENLKTAVEKEKKFYPSHIYRMKKKMMWNNARNLQDTILLDV